MDKTANTSPEEEYRKRLAKEEYTLRVLLQSPDFCAFIARIIRQSGCLGVVKFEGGGKDAYNRGRADFVQTFVVDRMVKFFGWAVIDDIFKKAGDL